MRNSIYRVKCLVIYVIYILSSRKTKHYVEAVLAEVKAGIFNLFKTSVTNTCFALVHKTVNFGLVVEECDIKSEMTVHFLWRYRFTKKSLYKPTVL